MSVHDGSARGTLHGCPETRVTSARKDSPEKYREPDLSQPGSSYEKGNRAAIRIPFCYCDGAEGGI